MADLDPQLIARISDALTKGQIPGYGSAQNETYTPSDNVDSGHGLNIRYIIPSNSQRVIAARLSFHLDKFRSYVSAVNNSASTSGGTPHVHYWTSGSGTIASSVGLTAGGVLVSNQAFGKQTSTEHAQGSVGGSADTSIEGWDATGHTHSVTPNVSLTYGVFEGATATNVSISFDGVDQTSVLGGPWTSDVVELDVLRYMNTSKGTYHLITLTPTTLGRIEAHLRFNFYVDASINA